MPTYSSCAVKTAAESNKPPREIIAEWPKGTYDRTERRGSKIKSNESTGEAQIRVLVVDAQPTMRLGLRSAIETAEDMLSIGEVEEIDNALRLIEESRPDVVVMELGLRGGEGGTELLRTLKSKPDAPGVVVHTARNSEEDVFASRVSGGDSFVYKGEEPLRVLEAVRETYAGKRVWFLGRKRHKTDAGNTDHRTHASANGHLLTRREKQVFCLLVQRYTNAEIAGELSISLQTAKNHVSSVLRKLGVSRRGELF